MKHTLKIEGADAQTARTLNEVEPARCGDATQAPVEALVLGKRPDVNLLYLESLAKSRRLAARDVEQERDRVKAAKLKKRAAEAAIQPFLRKWSEANARYETAEALMAAKIQREPIAAALSTQLGILTSGSTAQRWVAKGRRWGVALDVPHGEGVLHVAAWGDVSEAGLLETVNIGAAPAADRLDGESDGDYTMRLVDGIYARPMATLRQIQHHFSREVSWELDLRNGRTDMASLDAFMAALRLIASWGKALEMALTPTDAYLIQEGRKKLLEMQGQDTSHMIGLDRFVSRGEQERPLLDDEDAKEMP